MSTKDCVFCKIAKGQDEKTTLLYQDEKVVVFRDIRPAAEHHYLICPREHISNAKSLTSLHIPFVENLVEIGKQVLQEQKADISKARFGFHWPPFVMISHLHLHAISPADGIRTLCWLTGAFSPGMPWFKSADWVIDWLKTSGASSEASVSAGTVVPTGASANAETVVPTGASANAETVVPTGASANAETVVPTGASANAETVVPTGASANAETVVPTGASANAAEVSEAKNKTKPAETAEAAATSSS